MPVAAVAITPAGRRPVPFSAESLQEFASKEPPGVYTMTRTYEGTKVVLFDAHLDRLQESAELEDIPLKLDRSELRQALRDLIEAAGYGDCRLRITIPGSSPGEVLLAVEPLPQVPNRLKEEGVRTATISLARENPRAKSNIWVAQRRQARELLPEGTYEGLLIDQEGHILEGFSSNFYTIREQIVQTAEEHILKGISRRILLEVAAPSFEVQYQAPRLADLITADEAFLTSSSRGVIPIVQVNDQPVGNGRPGPKTVELAQRYDHWVNNHLEPL